MVWIKKGMVLHHQVSYLVSATIAEVASKINQGYVSAFSALLMKTIDYEKTILIECMHL
jgi:hypothetical protein